MEDADSGSLPAAVEVSTSPASPPEPIPSRIVGIGEGEIQLLEKDLNELSSSIVNLKEGLQGLRVPLVGLSETEDHSNTAKCWKKQVRELCYDTGDYFYDFTHSGNEFKMLEARTLSARQRFEIFKIQAETAPVCMNPLPHPPNHREELSIDHAAMVDEFTQKYMGNERELKVVPIVGPEGAGKTTLAKRLYRNIGESKTPYLRAFVRASPNHDIVRLLTSLFIQITRKQPSCRLTAHDLCDDIARYLQNKRYFMVIDDLWTTTVWGTISRAFPDGDCGSRIIITTQTKGVALACCGFQLEKLFEMKLLSAAQSKILFFGTVSGSESCCPEDLLEVSDGIISKCGGLPLATINIASMLTSTMKLEEWTGIRDSLPSTNPNTAEWMREIVNLIYSTLRPHLKTCLLYFSMYPEGYIVRKDDLVKQWIVEGFLKGIEGQTTEEVVGDYFDELVRRGLIQPVNTSKNGMVVLSCTLHHTVHNFIVNKSVEENFIITVDYSQSAIPRPDKVRRLSVQFGSARRAHIPESFMVSEVRSFAFFGSLKCFLSASNVKYRHVRVLVLHIWADEDKVPFDLSGIGELHLLRYLKIACNIAVKLPVKIQRQQYLEILEVDATLAAIPRDIVELSRLHHLKFAVSELSSEDICVLKEMVALTTLSVYVKPQVKTAPTKTIVLDNGGFLNLKFFTFRCMTPLLLIEEGAMPKIEKLNLCFNAHEARPDGRKPITIEHLESLPEISVIIGGAFVDASSALADAVTNHPRNPIRKLMESREEQEHGIVEEQDEIIEEDVHEYLGTQEKGLGECEIKEEDRDETEDEASRKDENKDADSRISMQTGSSSRPQVPVGWGIGTAGWILSPVFTRLVDKAVSHMEPGELNDNVTKLASQVIPQLKIIVEAAESSEDMVFFEELVRKLKSYFYELEETLDEVEYNRLESQQTGPSNQDIAFQSSQKLAESVTNRLTENLKKIQEALEESRDNIKLKKPPINRRSIQRRQQTASREPRVQVIGRDEQLEKITQLLHDTNDDLDIRVTKQNLHGVDQRSSKIIGIYGIAGSGKTTLAHHVYRSEKNADHFELFLWIHVSRNFSLVDIFREMLQQAGHVMYEDTGRYTRTQTLDSMDTGRYTRTQTLDSMDTREDSLEMLRRILKDCLRNKVFLLVLDDIWCDKDSDKYKLYELFSVLAQDGYKQSKILVTSQNKNSVSALGLDVKHTIIEIEDLNEMDFSNLFMSHAFGGNMIDMGVKESLKGIGAHIVKRLNGSPLAAALVGGLLRKEMTVDHWVSVKTDPYLLEGITGILWLCYQHLDEQARRCFAYCSIFTRRHRLEHDELVKLWVTEGFIEATDAGQMAELAKDYFGELVSSSFMHLGEKDSNGGKDYFLVHDLLHDIAEQVAGNDFFRVEKGWSGEVPLDVRHLFVQTSNRFLMKDVVNMEKLRTLIILTDENSIGNEVLMDILQNKIRPRKLRVLVVETVHRLPDERKPYSMPASIGDLKHIRYLAFRWRFGQKIDLSDGRFGQKIDLSDAFHKLYLLQVLDFGDCQNLLISCILLDNLVNLRHLILQGVLRGVRRLINLESLPFFRISKDSDYDCELSQLSDLHKLQGKLQVVGLEKVRRMDVALEAKLADKEGLRELVLQWGDYQLHREMHVTATGLEAGVLEGLCPSQYLEDLEIINYNGTRYPDWMVGNQDRKWRVQRLILKNCSPLVTGSTFFANVLRLTLQDCKWNALPDMEHLKKINVLIIYRCRQIKYWPGELPQSLKYLEICRCSDPFMVSCKILHIERKFIGYPRLQDPSQYPDEKDNDDEEEDNEDLATALKN